MLYNPRSVLNAVIGEGWGGAIFKGHIKWGTFSLLQGPQNKPDSFTQILEADQEDVWHVCICRHPACLYYICSVQDISGSELSSRGGPNSE